MSGLCNEVLEIVRSVSNVRIGDGDFGVPLKDLGVDSLEIANIFLVIVEKYSIEIPDEEIDRLPTVEQIVAYLGERLSKK